MTGVTRWLLPGLLLSFLAVEARAATCATIAACTPTAPCDWNTSGTWTCGHVPARAKHDTCVITANTTVVLSTDDLDCGGTTIDGTWVFDESPVGRDLNGYRTFTVGGDLNGNAGGALRMRAGHRLAFNAVTAPRVFMVNDGFDLDIQGQVHEAAIAALADDPANPVDCGPGAPRREVTIT